MSVFEKGPSPCPFNDIRAQPFSQPVTRNGPDRHRCEDWFAVSSPRSQPRIMPHSEATLTMNSACKGRAQFILAI